MAMEKLGQLRAQNSWDLIVVDTPPSRSALDFLDAPARLGSFLDGRLIRVLTAPARAGGRAGFRFVQVGLGVFTNALSKVLGGDLLRDVQTFVGALDSMFGGFRERADHTYALLQNPETTFVVVAAPEPDALREAAYFVERLAGDGMPLGGLVLNRVHTSEVPALTAEQAVSGADHLAGSPEHEFAEASLRLHAERMRVIEREQRLAKRFTTAHPSVPVVEVPAFSSDVHDLDGLRDVGQHLAKDA
jgi:anion-transporting  ArsA/GET3 family ATPase